MNLLYAVILFLKILPPVILYFLFIEWLDWNYGRGCEFRKKDRIAKWLEKVIKKCSRNLVEGAGSYLLLNPKAISSVQIVYGMGRKN